MLSAVILCRSSSSRLRNKHFYKIGNKSLIELIIEKLNKNKFISEVYIASGKKKKNSKYLILKKKFGNLNFFFHPKENDVTERIFLLSKKLKNEYSLIVSGDCPVIDENLIEILLKNIKIRERDYDLVKFNREVYYEGVNLVKTSSWKKIYLLSKKRRLFAEHFSKIFNINSKNLKIKLIKTPKSFIKPRLSKIRLSIDTHSDLNFFNALYFKLGDTKKINLQNVKKLKYLSRINGHVLQRKPGKSYNREFIFITAADRNIGFGHLKRCLVLKRQLEETYSTNTKLCYLRRDNLDKELRKQYQFKKLTFNKRSTLIVDLPAPLIFQISEILKRSKYRKVINIDCQLQAKKTVNIIPSPLKNIETKNLKSGKKYMILDHDLKMFNFENKKKYKLLILSGGSSYPDISLINYLKKKKIPSNIILGPLTNSKKVKSMDLGKKIKLFFNPKNYYSLISKSEKIICRFGVSTYECIALGFKPYVIIENETPQRISDIFFLKKQGYINIFDENKILSSAPRKLKFDLPVGAKFLNKLI